MTMIDEHYLKQELYALIQRDTGVFDFLQNASLDGLWYWDLENPEHEWMSPGFWELLGFNPAEKRHLPSEWQGLIHPDDLQTALHNLAAHCRDPGSPYDQVVRYRHKDGSTVWVRCRGIAIRDAGGKPVRLLGAHNDLTAIYQVAEDLRQRTLELEASQREQHQAQLQILEQAQHLEQLNRELQELAAKDCLTGLNNLRAFEEQVTSLIGLAERTQVPLSLMLIDVDHFKRINDRFGHGHGDTVLRLVAKALTATARDSDLVGRYGGDEFLVALPSTDTAESLLVAERFRSAVADRPWRKAEVTITVGVSTLQPPSGKLQASTAYARLLKQADQALYAAKKARRNRVRHYGQADRRAEQRTT